MRHMTGRRRGERQAACGRCSELLLAEFVRLAAYGSSERDLRRKLLSPRPIRRLHLACTIAQQARRAARLGAPRTPRPGDLEGLGTGRVGGTVHGVAAWHASPRDPYPSPRWGRGSARSAQDRRGSPRHVAATRAAEYAVRTPSESCPTASQVYSQHVGLQDARWPCSEHCMGTACWRSAPKSPAVFAAAHRCRV